MVVTVTRFVHNMVGRTGKNSVSRAESLDSLSFLGTDDRRPLILQAGRLTKNCLNRPPTDVLSAAQCEGSTVYVTLHRPLIPRHHDFRIYVK